MKAVLVQPSWEPSAVGYLRHVDDVYEAPVFITTARGATYVFLATLKTVVPKNKVDFDGHGPHDAAGRLVGASLFKYWLSAIYRDPGGGGAAQHVTSPPPPRAATTGRTTARAGAASDS